MAGTGRGRRPCAASVAMIPSRRRFLKAAAVLAPAVILTPGLLMKVRAPRLWNGMIGRIEGFAFIESEPGPLFPPKLWAPKLVEHFYSRNVLAELVGDIGRAP